MKTAYLNCDAGISGNMFVGALLDLGLSKDYLLQELQKLGLQLPKITISNVTRQGIQATLFEVEEVHEHHHRHLSDISNIVDKANLNVNIIEKVKRCFINLAEAEAKIHGTSIEEVHFHEVGALDAIVDIVGSCIGLDYLKIDQILVSPIRVGYGTITCAHGIIPIPAPATTELLTGFKIFGGEYSGEWATPTGAAILKTLAIPEDSVPLLKVNATGYGAGSQDRQIPNVFRIILGEDNNINKEEEIFVIETNIDDMNPEIFSYLGELIFAAGAKDYYVIPIQMKKGRPGVEIKIITPRDFVSSIEEIIITQTTTLGVRVYPVTRRCAEREIINVKINDENIRVKVARLDNKIVNYGPEYDDCAKVARKKSMPLKDVYEEVKNEARKILNIGGAS